MDPKDLSRIVAGCALLRGLQWRVRRSSRSLREGGYRSTFRGKGMEFEQTVRYEFGDDVRDIDWNVTARKGEPYRKKYVEERELSLLLLVEDSPSLCFGSQGRTKRETALEAAGFLAVLSAENRDRVAILHVYPGGYRLYPSKRHRRGILGSLLQLLTSRPPDRWPLPPLEIPWRVVHSALVRGGVLVWLGDFAGETKPADWERLRSRFELVGIRIDDPWEQRLPEIGVIDVLDPTSGEFLTLDTSSPGVRRRQEEWVRDRERRWKELFPSSRSACVLRTDLPVASGLAQFLLARRRQMSVA
ncbi:DUF58 domain-containing protein [Methylacidimicrobium sp. AP8]|uniref:DUF58 domain-containing protein n=1 Tax=Methylacidimicrobium sp. AP8 TaxID=2730359 RepID=UPI001F395B81|nr:DUF58 domain-containing protein [Methylacidimicrobium sp. AP8]